MTEKKKTSANEPDVEEARSRLSSAETATQEARWAYYSARGGDLRVKRLLLRSAEESEGRARADLTRAERVGGAPGTNGDGSDAARRARARKGEGGAAGAAGTAGAES